MTVTDICPYAFGTYLQRGVTEVRRFHEHTRTGLHPLIAAILAYEDTHPGAVTKWTDRRRREVA